MALGLGLEGFRAFGLQTLEGSGFSPEGSGLSGSGLCSSGFQVRVEDLHGGLGLGFA